MPIASAPKECARVIMSTSLCLHRSLCGAGPARISGIRPSRNPFTIEELYMKDERLVRGKAAAHHKTVTEGPPAEAADCELLTRIASRSEEAFRMLWDRFGAAVFTVCRRRLSDVGAAEDATQE